MTWHPRGELNPRYNTGLCMPQSEHRGIYIAWQNMRARCLRKNSAKYHRYGGRGIKICEAWLGIENFYKWALGSGWRRGLSLDRIDNDGDYCPENCHWVTLSENSKKKSTTRLTSADVAVIRTLIAAGKSDKEIAAQYRVNGGTIWHIRKGRTHIQ